MIGCKSKKETTLPLCHQSCTNAPPPLLVGAVCWRIRRGHHASIPGDQGEGVDVSDTAADAEPTHAAAEARRQELIAPAAVINVP
jgi:hypothetical protein